MTHLERIL